MKRTPSLRLDWGINRVLSEADLTRAALCMASFPPPYERQKHKPYDYYTAGLTLLSTNDVHWQCEVQTFGNFFESLRAMMEKLGDLQPGQPYFPALQKVIAEMIPPLNNDGIFCDILAAFDRKNPSTVTVTLREVAKMKILCDTYYLHRALKTVAKGMMVGSAEGEEKV
jgi:hypothetical protein